MNGGYQMYDFITAALPWVVIGLAAAIACANFDKLKLLWEKWDNSTK
jgi:hypothetical protein